MFCAQWVLYSLTHSLKHNVHVLRPLITFQSPDHEEDLNPQLACLVEGRGRVFIYHGGFVAFVDDAQTFITRME
ncbi:hypothetical protein THOB06_10517 [Vibrio rotiferianus]|nr:hypothetical protein THOB06_10517 [Vibrio rotiferianus]